VFCEIIVIEQTYENSSTEAKLKKKKKLLSKFLLHWLQGQLMVLRGKTEIFGHQGEPKLPKHYRGRMDLLFEGKSGRALRMEVVHAEV